MPACLGHFWDRLYSDSLRKVSYRDPECANVSLTNNFDLSPEVIAQLYRLRWRVELFFKWIKQNLRTRHFLAPLTTQP
jgi:IS4 transposase